MNTKMKKFRFFYQAPAGEKRYHCDMFCSLSDKAEHGKQYGDDPEKQKVIIWHNFTHSWNKSEKLRNLPVWHEATLEQITLSYEIVPESELHD